LPSALGMAGEWLSPAAEGGGQQVFRAVTQDELGSIQSSGQFSVVPGSSTPLPGVQGKWFYPNPRLILDFSKKK